MAYLVNTHIHPKIIKFNIVSSKKKKTSCKPNRPPKNIKRSKKKQISIDGTNDN